MQCFAQLVRWQPERGKQAAPATRVAHRMPGDPIVSTEPWRRRPQAATHHAGPTVIQPQPGLHAQAAGAAPAASSQRHAGGALRRCGAGGPQLQPAPRSRSAALPAATVRAPAGQHSLAGSSDSPGTPHMQPPCMLWHLLVSALAPSSPSSSSGVGTSSCSPCRPSRRAQGHARQRQPPQPDVPSQRSRSGGPASPARPHAGACASGQGRACGGGDRGGTHHEVPGASTRRRHRTGAASSPSPRRHECARVPCHAAPRAPSGRRLT